MRYAVTLFFLVSLMACTQPEPIDPTLKPIPRDSATKTGISISGDARFGMTKGL
ncbi:hypothetical protein [uncultured Roseobacter sp.]|uniref:hypothetical protein n=1 Tax=uncultured Roseobacter sp. TaxID=114847 RepID=UPI0026188409|nr:hypothetical protein [uncultured Roseobacter sp.]